MNKELGKCLQDEYVIIDKLNKSLKPISHLSWCYKVRWMQVDTVVIKSMLLFNCVIYFIIDSDKITTEFSCIGLILCFNDINVQLLIDWLYFLKNCSTLKKRSRLYLRCLFYRLKYQQWIEVGGKNIHIVF